MVMITKLRINIDATVHFHTCKVMITKLRAGLNGWLWQECNAEIMSIKGWDALWKCASDVVQAAGMCKDRVQVDLSPRSMPSEEWKNTVTVTGRGGIIVRLSWKEPIPWDDSTAEKAKNACNVICLVIENCC